MEGFEWRVFMKKDVEWRVFMKEGFEWSVFMKEAVGWRVLSGGCLAVFKYLVN